eukprot:gene11178-23352_t
MEQDFREPLLGSHSHESPHLHKLKVGIEGMSCSSCSGTIERSISALEGVKSVTVNLSTNSAVVIFDGNVIGTEVVCQTIEDVGFGVSAAIDTEIYNDPSEKAGPMRSFQFKVVGIVATRTSESDEDTLDDLQIKLRKTVGVTNLIYSKKEREIYLQIDDKFIGPRQLVSICNDTGVEVMVSHMDSLHMAERALQSNMREVNVHLRELYLCLLFIVPILTMNMVLPAYPLLLSLLTTMLLPGLSVRSLCLLAFASVIQFGVGHRFYTKAFSSCLRGTVGMDFLVSLGTSAAYLFAVVGLFRGLTTGISRDGDVSYFETSSVLITVVVLGKYLEVSARSRTAVAINRLSEKKGASARLVAAPEVIRDVVVPEEGQDRLIDAVLLHRGDLVRLVEGEVAPADGVLLGPSSAVVSMDEALLTGESRSVDKTAGDSIIGGSIVVTGTGVMRVVECGDSSTLGRLVSAMQDAQLSKPPIQEVADSVAKLFVPIVTFLSLITFLVWLAVGFRGDVPHWLMESYDNDPILLACTFALAVWVSACPCAFGLATPTAVLVSTGIAAQNGILVRRGASIQYAAAVTAVAFDKTGTLTQGRPEVSDFFLFETTSQTNSSLVAVTVTKDRTNDVNYSPSELLGVTLSLLGFVERRSSHPIAVGIVEYCEKNFFGIRNALGTLTDDASSSVVVFPGEGVSFMINTANNDKGDGDGTSYEGFLGSVDLMRSVNVTLPQETEVLAEGLRRGGKIVVFLAVAGSLRAIIGLADSPRAESRAVVEALCRKGVSCYMVTGDHAVTAHAIAVAVGIPVNNVLSAAKPMDKNTFVAELQRQGHVVGFVGDGTNDSLALAQANVGIALGNGTDIAIEAADMIICRNNIDGVLLAIELSRSTMRRIKLNYFWALAYNSALIPVAAGVLVPNFGLVLDPMFAGAAMAFSSVSIVLSSLSLLRFKPSFISIVDQWDGHKDNDDTPPGDKSLDDSCKCPLSTPSQSEQSPRKSLKRKPLWLNLKFLLSQKRITADAAAAAKTGCGCCGLSGVRLHTSLQDRKFVHPMKSLCTYYDDSFSIFCYYLDFAPSVTAGLIRQSALCISAKDC